MQLSEKIKHYRSLKGWNQEDLAKMSGVSIGSIKRYETNKGNITQETLEKLASSLNVNVVDFYSDKMSISQNENVHKLSISPKNLSISQEKMSISPKNVPKLSPSQENLSLSGSPMVRHSKNVPKSTQPTDLITIMHYKGIKASAGYGVENAELDAIPIETTKDFLRSFFKLTSFSNLEIITVYGDSMLPYLQDGETILIQRTSEVKNNQIIIIRVENDIYVKRYIKEPFTSTIKLISENKNYDDITITSEQFQSIQIIGVVCGSFRLR